MTYCHDRIFLCTITVQGICGLIDTFIFVDDEEKIKDDGHSKESVCFVFLFK